MRLFLAMNIWMVALLAMLQTDMVLPLEQASTAPPISMKLKSVEDMNSWIHINFYGDKFSKFYDCMSNNKHVTCTADLSRDEKQPTRFNDMRVIRLNKPELNDALEVYSDYFTCGYIFPDETLSCRRLPSMESPCEHQSAIQYFHFPKDSSLTIKCIGLFWDFPGESLLYNKSIHNIELCSTGCNETAVNSSTVKTNHSRTPWMIIVLHKSEHGDNQRWNHPKHRKGDYADARSHIIIAVVGGMGVTVVLVIAAGLFRRRLLRMRNISKENVEEDGGTSPPKHRLRKKSVTSRTYEVDPPQRRQLVSLNPSTLLSSAK